MVPVWNNSVNRVEFDSSEFIKSLKEDQVLPNYEYVEKYMMPQVINYSEAIKY